MPFITTDEDSPSVFEYIDLTFEEGRRYLPHIQNLFFKPLTEGDFYVEPWRNRELRDCAEVRSGVSEEEPDEVWLFTADPQLIAFFKATTEQLYMFGAYNQINVCQMRARGTVTCEEGHPETDQIKFRLWAGIQARVGTPVSRLSDSDAQERESLLKKGTLFCFRISSYAYETYERG